MATYVDEEDIKSWSLNNNNGTPHDDVVVSISCLLSRQRGPLLSIQKIAKWLRVELAIRAKHRDIRDIMFELGATCVESTARNKYIFDITECVLEGVKEK